MERQVRQVHQLHPWLQGDRLLIEVDVRSLD
jgi:hypothetical protein